MGLFSQTIKNLISGISQQPSILRHPEQLEYQENAMSTEVGGLQKRPPLLHIKTLDKSVLIPGVKPFVHIINRDSVERYTVMFNGDGVHIWDMQGNKKTVNYQDEAAKAYLTSAAPRKKIKAVTVADFTFVVNTDKTIVMSSEVVPNVWSNQGGLVNVKSGQYGRTYSIIINGSTIASFTTPDGSVSSHSTQIDTNYIANQLASEARTNGWTVSQGEGWLYIYHATTKVNTIDTKDGFNNNAMFGFTTSAQKFTNLPSTAPNGYTIEIVGEGGSYADNYYVKYNSTDKVWKETARPGVLNSMDASTMPHILIRQADGTFLFKRADWDKRVTGDDDSNPEPSFVDNTINDIFFFRNRLGFIAGENVILSKSGDFFKFWMSSAIDVLDTDTIDLAVSHNVVSILYHAVPFAEELLLFSAQTQFVLRAEGVLSPKNSRIDQVTEFECNIWTRPVGAGRRLYFPAERALYSSIKEFYAVQDVTNVKNAQDVTSHVPSYIPNGVYRMMSSTTENILLVLTEGQEDTVYAYKYLFTEEQRVQTSWSHWTLGAGSVVLGGGFIGATLYLMVQRGAGVSLEKMLFTYNTKDYPEEPYRVFMDRKVVTDVIPTVNYNSVYDTTSLDIQGLYGEVLPNETYGIVGVDGVFRQFTTDQIVNGVVTLDGRWDGQKVVVGELFNFKIQLSEQMLKTTDERGTRSDTEGRLQLRSMWLNYVDSGYFQVIVEHVDKETYTYDMTARILGSGHNLLGSMPVETGQFKFPIQELASNTKIYVESNYPSPVALIGAGWEGNYYRRSERL